MNYIEVRRVRGLIEDRVGFNHAREKNSNKYVPRYDNKQANKGTI